MNFSIISSASKKQVFLGSLSQNWHFLLSGLVLPSICAVSLLENSLAIVVLLKIRPGRGIGATSRAYYIVLAFADIGSVVGCQLGKQFAEYGLRYLTDSRLYFSLPNMYCTIQ